MWSPNNFVGVEKKTELFPTYICWVVNLLIYLIAEILGLLVFSFYYVKMNEEIQMGLCICYYEESQKDTYRFDFAAWILIVADGGEIAIDGFWVLIQLCYILILGFDSVV